MRCRCGLIQEPEKPGRFLCMKCEGEGWTLTPAGYIHVPELARETALELAEQAKRPAARRRKSGKGTGKRRR